MSSVRDGQANEELGPFDLSKMTAREIAEELVRRRHPTPPGAPDHADAVEIQAEPTNPTDGNQDVLVPLPAFLREGDRQVRARGWDWPPDRTEGEERDPLDVLSRALHNHLQDRRSEELASTGEPLNLTGGATVPELASTDPVAAAETCWPAVPSSARLSESLDIPAQPSAEITAGEPALDTLATETERPGIRRIRSSDRATERAKIVAQLWLASASAQASNYAARLHLGRRPRPDMPAAEFDAPMAMIPSSVVSEDLVPEKASFARKAVADRLAWARRSLSEGVLGRIGARRVNWRGIHWEAVVGGMLLGIVLTIGPAIYFLTAPGRAPAPTVMAPGENPLAADTSSVEPSPAIVPAAPEPATASAALMEPPPPPLPTILQPDPTALATAAGGTSSIKDAALQTTGPQTTTSQPPSAAATPAAVSKTPPVKPATQKASTKKQKPKAGTISAHQAASTEQLSPAKR